MATQKGFAHLIVVLIIAILVILGYLIFTKKLPIGQQDSSSSSDSQPLLKTDYQNPFDEKVSYSNPFSDYQNPFDNLTQ